LKTKVEFIRTVLLNVRDEAKEFVKSTRVTLKSYALGITTFDCESVEGFSAGDSIYFDDKTANSVFATILAVDITNKRVTFTGDYHLIPAGIEMVKTEALHFLDNAIKLYSKFRPLNIGKEITGNNTSKYSLPDNWADGFSLINFVEKPIGYVPTIEYNKNNYQILYDINGVPYLQFSTSISSSEKFNLYYTTTHFWKTVESIVGSTASDNDFYCICNITSALYLLGLAAFYGQSSRNIISADNVNHNEKVDAYRRLANSYLTNAANWLGISFTSLNENGKLSSGPASSSQDCSAISTDGKGLLKDYIKNQIIQ
jgi:hypothetical protein